jgi:hypothetical protein
MFAALNSFLTRAVTGYFLNKSLRFRSSASAYLNRTPATDTNQKTWTWSGWVKRGTLGTTQYLFGAYTGVLDDEGLFTFSFSTANNIYISAATLDWRTTTAVYRDPAAWYHIVVAFDTTQSTAANRIKLYVNGAQVTAFGTTNDPVQNTDYAVNSANVHRSGVSPYIIGTYFDGEMAEVNFVDGQALAPTAFGAYSTYNQWLPIRYAGTYGTNGFYLPFTGSTTSTAYSGAFNGSTQYLSLANNTLLSFGSGDFTIEGWVYANALGSYNAIFGQWLDSGSTSNNSYVLESVGSTMLFYWVSGTTLYGPATLGTITTGAWIHYAICRSGSTLYPFKNGVLGTTVSITQTLNSPTTNVTVGGQIAGAGYWDGYISNLRVVKGTAVYTTTFTPSTVPLTAIANTSLLTLQNATIVDNSGNSLAITNFNAVTTTVQSPFVTSMIAADSSGNGNNWSTNNISLTGGSTYDSLTDVPTLTSETVANYGTLNPLYKGSQQTISNGNLTSSKAVGTTISDLWGNFGMTSGKWYFECSVTALAGTLYIGVGQGGGIGEPLDDLAVSPTSYFYTSFNGDKNYGGTSAAYGNSYTVGDVIGCAVDMTNGKIWWSKNGTWQASGDPAAGTNAAYTDLLTRGSNAFLVYSAQNAVNNSNTLNWNFGQQPFVYTAPSGFLPLNTFNI